MRFGLLIVVTVALLSVAFRINSHDTATQSRPPSRPAGIPSTQPSSQVTSPVPSTQPSTPSSSPSSSSTQHVGHRQPTTGQPVSAGTQQILPVTGWDSTVKLGALAFLLIGGGTLALRVGAPRPQPAETVQD